MSCDYWVELDCAPRRALGNGDVEQGGNAILETLKAAAHASLIEQVAAERGVGPDDIPLRFVQSRPEGSTEVELRHSELLVEAARFGPHAGACEGCAANVRESPAGCYLQLAYPVKEATEAWLLERLQPPGTVGGFLLERALDDFGYDGEPVKEMRHHGLFELEESPSRDWSPTRRVRADQIWHGILQVGASLDPGHLMGVLLWLGALRVNGRVPGEVRADASLLQKLLQLEAPAQRAMTAGLVLGLETSEEVAEGQRLLQAFYASWVTGAPVRVDP